ncbi:superoxide dismutase [Aliikangiella coralliicola]|uniref:Superoxide dismutase n=1 Tax=Aliikangiella coralliicola TaxID=2592383 RepID=A0A545U4T7_9GAMM|nr:Fe-Mn family superoxide dismutase [Aliikangiella coralliicola]TQV84485.1 superoxide dismutase [Fe] [Aliikangiella coralliicola]
MSFELPALPYAKDALAPTISEETIDFHYGKHHNTYVVNLNKLVADTEFASMSLEEVIVKSEGGVFNNAAQIWNHTFYWNCLTPNETAPSAELAEAINAAFGSIDEFKSKFITSATTNFGSGWTWLVKNAEGSLEIVNTSNAGCPLTENYTPLLTIDVWEHAYYIDYRNARPKYLESIWGIINWDFVSGNFAG